MVNEYISSADRKRIINSYISGNTVSSISTVIGFKILSVYAIIKFFNANGTFERKQKGGVRQKSISDAHKEIIRKWIDNDCSLS